MSVDLLKEDLKKNHLRSLYLFYGPEEYMKKFYVESMEKQLLTDDLKVMNKIVLEGKQEIGKIIDHCETLPVFSERKLVVVKNSGLFKPRKKGGEEAAPDKPQNDKLSACLQDLPSHTCLIFWEAEIDKRMKAVDAVKKQGLLVEFAFLKPDELVRWVVKKFKAAGKDIDMAAASQLVENSEQGMTEIANEVEKALDYAGDSQRVTLQDIENVCTRSIKSRIFDLTDAIAEGKGARALKLLNDMVILKEPMPKVLFMITRQFRQILQLKLLSTEGVAMNEMASRLGVTPYAVSKIAKQAGSFNVDRLKQAIAISLEFDLAIKTGKLDDRMAAELMIMEFSK